jgi:hypothetical protein
MPLRREDRGADTGQEPLAQRLWSDMVEQLAKHVGCCAIHGIKLICPWCDVVWTASASEEREAETLVERTMLYHLTWPTWPCGRCGAQAMCVGCYEPVREQAFAGLSPDEELRLSTLLGTSMRYTCMPDPGETDAPTGAHEKGETP